MIEPGLAAALSHLDDGNPGANITAIKQVVANYLTEADPASSVRTTDYFNHTFSPDLILRWGSDEGSTRRVFIRTDARVDSLREDINWMEAEAPLVIPLSNITGAVGTADDQDPDDLESTSRRRGAMVTSPAALENLHQAVAASPLQSAFSQAVVRGGRGVVSADRAARVGSLVAEGYAGAQIGAATSTAAAIAAIEDVVVVPQAVGVTRILQAVWIGGGAEPTKFPGATGLSLDQLASSSLQFLLDLAEVGDDVFWERVSAGLELADLESLNVAPESERFQQLVWASFARLRGRNMAIAQEPNPFLGAAELKWFARDGFLGLQAQNFRAGFTSGQADQLSDLAETVGSGEIGIRQLLERLDSNGLGFSELRLVADSGSILTFSPASSESASSDSLLAELTGPLEQNATVARVNIPMRDSRDVICNLSTMRTYGRTASKYYLTELLATAFPVMYPLSEEQKGFVDRSVASPFGGGTEDEATDGGVSAEE